MNILWIVNHDVSPDFGCYGNEQVFTPNLDKLASEGVRFTRAYTTCPVCSPARSGFHTGRYPAAINAHNHRSHRGDGFRVEGLKTIAERFRAAGWHTANYLGESVDAQSLDLNFEYGQQWDSLDWNERKEGQPFFGYVQFSEPHRAFVSPEEVTHPIDPNSVELPPYYADDPIVRRDYADYLNSIEILDQKIGSVLDKLEADGLAQDTAVFYFADHGRAHFRDKQFLYEGGIHVPMIARCPGSDFVAGSVVDNLVSTIDVAATSLSLAGLDEEAVLDGIPFWGPGAGIRKHIFSGRDRCDGTLDSMRCVSDGRYKYIQNGMPEKAWSQFNLYKEDSYPGLRRMRALNAVGKLTDEQSRFFETSKPIEELYDLEVDPGEADNLAGNALYQSKLDDLRAILKEWQYEIGDCGRTAEPEDVVDYEVQEMRRLALANGWTREQIESIG